MFKDEDIFQLVYFQDVYLKGNELYFGEVCSILELFFICYFCKIYVFVVWVFIRVIMVFEFILVLFSDFWSFVVWSDLGFCVLFVVCVYLDNFFLGMSQFCFSFGVFFYFVLEFWMFCVFLEFGSWVFFSRLECQQVLLYWLLNQVFCRVGERWCLVMVFWVCSVFQDWLEEVVVFCLWFCFIFQDVLSQLGQEGWY